MTYPQIAALLLSALGTYWLARRLGRRYRVERVVLRVLTEEARRDQGWRE